MVASVEGVDVKTALANEARRGELRQKIAHVKGSLSATASVISKLSSVNGDQARMLEEYQSEMEALEAGAGPGITADYGQKSTVTQMVEKERFAAKAACVEFIKANPECTEEEAAAAWDAAALANHPDFPAVLQGGMAMSALYRRNLHAAGLIPEGTWEAHRQWVLNTPLSVIEVL